MPLPPVICEQPDDSVTIEERKLIEADARVKVGLFGGGVGGSSDRSVSYESLKPAQEVTNIRWYVFELCKLAQQQRVLDPVQYCTISTMLLGQAGGVTLDAAMVEKGCAGSTSSVSAVSPPTMFRTPGSGSSSSACTVLKPIDSLIAGFKGLVGFDNTTLWDSAAKQGFMFSLKGARSDVIRFTGAGELEIETNFGRVNEMSINPTPYKLPAADVQGWRIEDGRKTSLSNGSGLNINVADAMDLNIEDIFLVPGDTTFLVTVGYSSASRNAIEVRTWTIDLACLPR